MLTTDQRTLLLRLRDADILLDDGGWDRLMQSRRGGCSPHREGEPRHTIRIYDCGAGKITAEWHDGTTTVITKAQFSAYRRTLAPVLRESLEAARAAQDQERRETAMWCMCPAQRGEGECKGRLPWDRDRERPHPSDDEYRAHVERERELRHRVWLALRAALLLTAEPEVGTQLELFGATA